MFTLAGSDVKLYTCISMQISKRHNSLVDKIKQQHFSQDLSTSNAYTKSWVKNMCPVQTNYKGNKIW